jgi:hypothetical protein
LLAGFFNHGSGVEHDHFPLGHTVLDFDKLVVRGAEF